MDEVRVTEEAEAADEGPAKEEEPCSEEDGVRAMADDEDDGPATAAAIVVCSDCDARSDQDKTLQFWREAALLHECRYVEIVRRRKF